MSTESNQSKADQLLIQLKHEIMQDLANNLQLILENFDPQLTNLLLAVKTALDQQELPESECNEEDLKPGLGLVPDPKDQ